MKKTIFFLLIIFSVLNVDAKNQSWVRHLEPTFWWTQMQQTELQLMFNGLGISAAEFSVHYPGVTVLRKELTDNMNYAFVYLNIAKEAKAGKFYITIKIGKVKQTILYELKARRNNSAGRAGFTEADAIYLLMPDRFANGSTANDSINGYCQGVNRKASGARHGGDIDGIISKIPYIADLGATTLWTTPLFENNDTAYSYHHYGCTDYYKVDPRFGKNEDYLRLSQTSHDNGLKIIIDVVPNHCCSQHWWLKDVPAQDWFNVWSTFTSSNYRMTAWTDPHASEADLFKLTHGWFAPNMPDFNLNNPLLFDYLRQVYVYWIEYANIDGIRVDTYPYNDIRVAAKFIQSIRNEYPKMNVVGECWVKTPAEVAYYQSGNNNKDGFDSHLTSVMDFCLKDVFATSFNENESWDGGMSRFYAHFAQDFVYPNANMVMNFLDNHDIDRYSTAVKRDVKKYKMGLALLTMVRGYPQIYYGTEIMIDGTPGDFQGHRYDFPGGWAADKRNAFTAEGRTIEENEVFSYTKLLLNYRKKNPVVQNGLMKQFIPENGIYVFFRYNKDKTIMVIANNNQSDKELQLSRFAEMLKSKSVGNDIITTRKYDLNQPVSVPAKTVLILEIK